MAPRSLIVVTLAMLSLPLGRCRADANVVVSALADRAYTDHKYADGKPRAETYVVMQGHYFSGTVVDHSIDRMPFHRLADYFAPELARQQYWPAKDAKDADLLIVVHWGTTSPQASAVALRAHTSTVTDMRENAAVISKAQMLEQAAATNNSAVGALLSAYDPIDRQLRTDALDVAADQARTDLSQATTAQLLGYTRDIRRMNTSMGISTAEGTLRSDLGSDRYFIILKAYSLREKLEAGQVRRAVWTLHLNMRSPGINFPEALDRMSAAAVGFLGRTTDEVTTVPARIREGKVDVGTPVIVSEHNK